MAKGIVLLRIEIFSLPARNHSQTLLKDKSMHILLAPSTGSHLRHGLQAGVLLYLVQHPAPLIQSLPARKILQQDNTQAVHVRLLVHGGAAQYLRRRIWDCAPRARYRP